MFWNQEFCIKPIPFSSYPEFTKRTKQIFLGAFGSKLTTCYMTVLRACDAVTCEDRGGGRAAGQAHVTRARCPRHVPQRQRCPSRAGSSNSGTARRACGMGPRGPPRGPSLPFHYKEEGLFLNFSFLKMATESPVTKLGAIYHLELGKEHLISQRRYNHPKVFWLLERTCFDLN